jgi:hypothetical protein
MSGRAYARCHARHSRSKNGVASLAYRGHPVRRSMCDLATDALEYWVPAFAGTTTET